MTYGTSFDEEMRNWADFHLTEVEYLPCFVNYGFEDTVVPESAMKNLLMNKGALSIFYLADQNAINEEYQSVYNPEGGWGDHVVTVVGWDDTFPKEHFNTETPEDDAWLVKNSWGTDDPYMDGGYFWLLYYDKSLIAAPIMRPQMRTLIGKAGFTIRSAGR